MFRGKPHAFVSLQRQYSSLFGMYFSNQSVQGLAHLRSLSLFLAFYHLLLQRHQLLGARGVNGNAAVKVGLGGAHLDGNAEALQHLSAALAHDVQADNLLFGASDDELVIGGALLLRVHHGVVHGREARLVDLDVLLAVLLDCLRLRQADAAYLGVSEDDGGDVAVVELGRLEFCRSEKSMRELSASGDGNGRQLDLAGHVAEGENVIDAAVLIVVDDDEAVLVQLDAGLLQADAAGLGCSAHSQISSSTSDTELSFPLSSL